MSKTSQRERRMYQQGYAHAKEYAPFAWRRHPQLERYSAGYKKAKREMETKKNGIIQRLIDLFGFSREEE